MSQLTNVFIFCTFSPFSNESGFGYFTLKDHYKKAEILCNVLLPVGTGALFSRLVHKVRVVKSCNIQNGFKDPRDHFPSTYSLLSS